MAVANTGVYRFQIRFNFLRHPDGTCTEHTGPVDAVAAATPTPGNSVFSIKWKRGAKQGNKGVVGPVARYSRPGGKGDYIFNAVIETEVNMRRKDEKDEGKGFAVKTLELAVKEHSLDESGAVKIKTVFECEFNLASAMPPTKDISPHMMLRRAMGSQKEVSLSVSVGYRFLRKIDSEGGASRFGLCSAAGAARPSAPGQPRSQAAPWWSCSGAPASAAPDARGRDANGALKRRSMSADAAQSWWRCSGPASAPPQGTRPVRAGDDAADRGDVPRRVHFSDDIDTKFISSASLQRERGGRRGAGGAAAEDGFDDGDDDECGAGEEDIEYLFVKGENGEADVAAGSDSDEEEAGGDDGAPPPERKRTVGEDLLSNSGQVGRGLGSGTIPLTPNLYTRRPSNSEKGAFMRSTQLPSKAAPKPRPGLLGRTRGTLKKSGGFTNGGQDSDGSPKAVETVCNKDVFFHEIDVRPMKRGVSYANRYTSTDSDVALFARGLMGSLDVFSSISDMEVRPDHQTEVELGGLSIPRLWMLLWGMHTDFVPSLHILAKDKNVRRSNWDINDDNDRALKWCGSQFSTWTAAGKKKLFGKPMQVIEDAYFCAFKFGDAPSVLYIHTSQRQKTNMKGPRVETLYKFFVPPGSEKDSMVMQIKSKLLGVNKSALKASAQKNLHKQVLLLHTHMVRRALEKTQVFLMKKTLQPSIAGGKRVGQPRGDKKRAQVTLTKRECKKRMRKHGASMGSIGVMSMLASARFSKFGGSQYGSIRVRNLDSYMNSTGGASGKLNRPARKEKPSKPKAKRISDLPWKELSEVKCVVHEQLCLSGVKHILEALKNFTTSHVQKEGFNTHQILVVVRVLSVYPHNNPAGGILEASFEILQVMCSVSLVTVLDTPNAVQSISAAYRCSGGSPTLQKFKPLVESLEKYQAKRSVQAKTEGDGVSKTLAKHYNVTEEVLERFTCTLVSEKGNKGSSNVKGVLYITRSWLCFSSQPRRIMISTYDITKVGVKTWLLGTTLFVYAENRCIDPLDFNNPHRQTSVFEFSMLFQKNVGEAIRSVVRGGGRPRVRLSQQL